MWQRIFVVCKKVSVVQSDIILSFWMDGKMDSASSTTDHSTIRMKSSFKWCPILCESKMANTRRSQKQKEALSSTNSKTNALGRVTVRVLVEKSEIIRETGRLNGKEICKISSKSTSDTANHALRAALLKTEWKPLLSNTCWNLVRASTKYSIEMSAQSPPKICKIFDSTKLQPKLHFSWQVFLYLSTSWVHPEVRV